MRAITMYVHISLLLLLTDKKERVSAWGGGSQVSSPTFFWAIKVK